MVSGHIPENSLFRSYKDLKRHWKNSYGYRLPEHEDGMIYLTVKFGHWFSESLTYPIPCVRAGQPVFLRQREPHRVLSQLLADLHAKVPYVCGFPFGVDATIRYALPKLNTLSEPIFPSNLSLTRPGIKKNYVKEEKVTADAEHPSQPVSQYTQTQTSKLTSQPDNRDSFSIKVPVMRPEDKKYCLRKGERPAVIEHFSQPVSHFYQTQIRKLTSQSDYKTRSISPPPFLPQIAERITPTTSKAAFVPIFTAKARTSYNTTAPFTSCWPSISSPSSSPTRSIEEPVRPMFGSAPIKPMFGLAKPSPSSLLKFNTSQVSKNIAKPKSTVHFPLFNNQVSSRPFNIGKGEKTLLNLPESGSKKVRNKPQIQQGVDVKALAQTKNGLNRVNTTTLIAYLRAEGVPCKVKDKKGDLVTKVLNHLNLPLPSNLEDKNEQV